MAEDTLQSLAYPANEYPGTFEDKPPELTQLNIIQVDSTISKLLNYPLIHPVISFLYFAGGIAAAVLIEWVVLLVLNDFIAPAFSFLFDGGKGANVIHKDEIQSRIAQHHLVKK